ncbi:MAG: hypothetical protein H2184_15890 [Candidatus Galacturonibacter soehngenii]|nr:hypothetical protein [Candidatus Galacturonibacter soehngenii]
MLARIRKTLEVDLSSFIDMLSGVLYVQIHFFQAAMAIGALLFISLFSPNSRMSYIIPVFSVCFMEDIKNEFLSGDISNMIFNLFLMFEVFRLIVFLLSIYSKKQKIDKIIETIFGLIVVYIGIIINPVLSADRIIFSIIGFYIILLILNILTRIFSIDTRHFGYRRIVRSQIPKAVKKEK